MTTWASVKAAMQAFRAALDPTAFAQLEARVAGEPFEVVEGELIAAQHKLEATQAKLVAGVPSWADTDDIRRLFEAERDRWRREMAGGGAMMTPAQAAAVVRAGTVGFGGGSGGGGYTGAASSSTTGTGGGGKTGQLLAAMGQTVRVGSLGRPRSHPTRVSQAEFVQVASLGDLQNNVLLQGDDGPGDLLRLAGYTVQPDPATDYLVLTHCEPTPRGATWKDSKRPFPPKGMPYWVRDVSLGVPGPDGKQAVVIHVSHGDRVDTGDGKQPAQRAVDRLRFIPEEDVLEMASKYLVRGAIDGVPWVLNDSARGELPLLYIANEGQKAPVWAELYARLLLGEEE